MWASRRGRGDPKRFDEPGRLRVREERRCGWLGPRGSRPELQDVASALADSNAGSGPFLRPPRSSPLGGSQGPVLFPHSARSSLGRGLRPPVVPAGQARRLVGCGALRGSSSCPFPALQLVWSSPRPPRPPRLQFPACPLIANRRRLTTTGSTGGTSPPARRATRLRGVRVVYAPWRSHRLRVLRRSTSSPPARVTIAGRRSTMTRTTR